MFGAFASRALAAREAFHQRDLDATGLAGAAAMVVAALYLLVAVASVRLLRGLDRAMVAGS